MTNIQDELVRELLDTYIAQSLRESYISYKYNESGIPFYSYDEKEEAKEVKKMMKALKRVHNYYTAPSEHL